MYLWYSTMNFLVFTTQFLLSRPFLVLNLRLIYTTYFSNGYIGSSFSNTSLVGHDERLRW
jgi:hypothetical protein